MVTTDELTVVLKAREFVNGVNPATYPVSVKSYVEHIEATLKVDHSLGPDEDGWSAMRPNGKYGICVNGNQRKERQRFTVCHELAHIILEIPSEHGSGPSWSYAKRSPNEILCDVFAAELLLPYKLFKPLVDKSYYSLAAIDLLADRFEASTMATGSRFATMARWPCAFVLSEQGKVRYSSRSRALRDARVWIAPRMDLPAGSVCERRRAGDAGSGPEQVEADMWFEDWDRDGLLLEDARHLTQWDQTIALLWFEDDDVPPARADRRQREEEEFGLAELDGVLPWPGKKKRR
jgi:Zn-dependent peptidase ImmA (M78 family)